MHVRKSPSASLWGRGVGRDPQHSNLVVGDRRGVFLGLIVTVTGTAVTPPCPSSTLIEKVSCLSDVGALTAEAACRAAAVGR